MSEKDTHHIENDPEFKGLAVNQGIEQPDPVSNDSVKRFLKKKKLGVSHLLHMISKKKYKNQFLHRQ